MEAVKITFTIALVTTTVLSSPTLRTTLKPSAVVPGQSGQPVVQSSHADAVSGGQVVGSKSSGEPKRAERLEGVRSVSSDSSITAKKQSASDGSIVQATQQVSTHDVTFKDAVVQLKKSVKLNNEESLPMARDEHEEGKEGSIPAEKSEESVRASPKVSHSDATRTDNWAPGTAKPQEPAKPLKGIIEDVRDLAVPEDAVELPRDVTKLSEDNSKTPVATPEDQPKTDGQADLTTEGQKVPSAGLVPGHTLPDAAECEVERHQEKTGNEDSKKPHEASSLASADVAPESRPETDHKVSKREDIKHGLEKDFASHAANNTGSSKTKTAKSEVSKPAHTKVGATKLHIKAVQETGDETKPIGFKTSRASPETAEIDARESDTVAVQQSPDATDSSQASQASSSATAVQQAPAPQAAVPTTDAGTPQEKPSSQGLNDTAKNLTATPTESSSGFNPFETIRIVLQPVINAATAVRDQIRPVIGAALSPVLGPLSPGKGGAVQNSSTATEAPQAPTSEEAAISLTGPPQKEPQTGVPTQTAPVAVEEGGEAPELRADDTGAASDARTVLLPAAEASGNQSRSPLGDRAAANAAVRGRPTIGAAVSPIADAAATSAEAEPQPRASEGMPESAAAELGEQRRYSNYKLFSVYIGNDTAALDIIRELREKPEVDFWNEPTLNRTVSFLIPPELVEQIQNLLKNAGIEYQIVTDDIQRWIDREEEENRPDVFLEQRDVLNYSFDKYHRVEEITGYLDLLAQKYSHIATVRNIGMTQEGRPIKGVILSTGSARPVLWFDAGIHAREWVAPASLVYFLHKMTTGYGSDSTVTALLQTFDFYIFPVVNPDGYAYTFLSDRLWRKNRSGGRRGCRGVDPNRNFAAAFGGAGTSGHPCSDIYRGAQAFSEAESRAIRDGILELGSRAKGYVTVHSYSQLLMVPYGHGRGTYTRDYADQIASARAVSRAIQTRSGVFYQVGTISSLLGSSAGSSSDWVYDSAKIKYSLAVELRDKGRYGFLLPNFLIVPTADEAAEGFKAFAKFIARRELNKSIP